MRRLVRMSIGRRHKITTISCKPRVDFTQFSRIEIQNMERKLISVGLMEASVQTTSSISFRSFTVVSHTPVLQGRTTNIVPRSRFQNTSRSGQLRFPQQFSTALNQWLHPYRRSRHISLSYTCAPPPPAESA